MLKLKFLIIFLSSIISADILEINNSTKDYDLLSNSQIYVDYNKSLTIEKISKNKIIFKDNDKKNLGYGYSPKFDVWIKFTLKNTTTKTINKIVEYDNPLTTDIYFFNPKDNFIKKEGLFHIDKDRKTLNPIFNIQLKPNEIKTYYIKAASHITTLIIKLKLWDKSSFYEKEIKHQFILALFFGAMFILAVYNLFIFFFTKDISYLYYVLYIFGIIIHHLLYVGIGNIYIFNQAWSIFVVENAALFVAFPALALAYFTKSFLHTKNYPRINKILNIFIILVVITALIFISTDVFNKYRNLLPFLLLVFLMGIAFYAAIKKNRQAYFILFAWVIFITAGMFMYFSSAGIFNIFKYFNYYIEIALVLEATIFSIALADRIKQLQYDKLKANNKLITLQQNENKSLESMVSEKTSDLKSALDDKEILLKELNHRVKNNMQMIVSLIRLQIDSIEDKKFNDMLITIQNRISAMSHLHELLYFQDAFKDIDANEYFRLLISEIQESYDKNINIIFDINSELKIEQAVYCGLILNELITNSFKHAFNSSDNGNINIKLSKNSSHFKLLVSDDGIGYDKNKSSNSLGLILVESLVTKKLSGTIKIDSKNGVKVEIEWG